MELSKLMGSNLGFFFGGEKTLNLGEARPQFLGPPGIR